MDNPASSAVWGLLLGASLVAGAFVASATRLPEPVAATILAFGGGVLLAAVALELVPAAMIDNGLIGTIAKLHPYGGTKSHHGSGSASTVTIVEADTELCPSPPS